MTEIEKESHRKKNARTERKDEGSFLQSVRGASRSSEDAPLFVVANPEIIPESNEALHSASPFENVEIEHVKNVDERAVEGGDSNESVLVAEEEN